MNYFKDKESNKGLLGTIAFHIILLISFILMGMTQVDPIENIDLTLEFESIGGVTEISNEENLSSESEITPQHTDVSQISKPEQAVADHVAASENILTDSESDIFVPSQESKINDVNNTADVVNEVEPIVPQISDNLQRFIDQVASPSPPSEDIISDDIHNGPSVGSDHSINDNPDKRRDYFVGDRTAKHLPKPQSAIQESGKVIVNIKVDRYGNVTWAKAGAKGSTITNKTQFKEAEDAAYKAKFSINAKAVGEQKGTITYNFVLN